MKTGWTVYLKIRRKKKEKNRKNEKKMNKELRKKEREKEKRTDSNWPHFLMLFERGETFGYLSVLSICLFVHANHNSAHRHQFKYFREMYDAVTIQS